MAVSIWGETQQMAVLHLRETGHVLGATTVLGAGEAPPSAESLAGDAMFVQDGPRVPRAHLTTSWVAFKQAALLEPMRYVLQDKSVDVSSAVDLPDPTLTTTKIEINLGPIAREAKYFVRIENDDGNPAFESAGKALPKTPPSDVTLPLEFDTPLVALSVHRVLIAVTGRPLFVKDDLAPQ